MKQKTPKISIGFLTSLLFIGFIGPNKASSTTAADFPATDPDGGKFYPATFLSPEIAASKIFQAEVQNLYLKAVKKKQRFSGLNAFTIQNPNNGKTYTLLSGFTPMPYLKKHEIDVLKILCGLRSEFLRAFFHFPNPCLCELGCVDYPSRDHIVSILSEFARNLECYFSFLQDTLSDRDTRGALEFYKGHISNFTDLFLCFSTDDRKARLNSFQKGIQRIEADLKNIQGLRFYPLSDFFHTEMLLLYAIEKDIIVQDFDINFGIFKERPLFLMCSYNEMCPKCEGFFGKYLQHNQRKQFIVAYLNEQTSHKRRTFVAELPLENFFKVYIPIPKMESPKPPKAKHRSTAPKPSLSVASLADSDG
ncbi:MAG: hypothetical protein LBD60_03715 [Puniceicoccales bacterium]|jgi:hypothetical protein|nr:hypothetical protein [Puniceicoccales bacterium]